MRIQPATPDDLGTFFAYLNDHLADNGADGLYFQPLSRSNSRVPPEMAEAFRKGLTTPVGDPGWRRLWLARSADEQIVGHVDLRARPEACTQHRCLLGMGVDRDHRQSGIGAALLAHAHRWATANTGLDWIDLQVLSGNAPAIRLYLRAGFARAGELPDMFRIDGESLAYTSMSLLLVKS